MMRTMRTVLLLGCLLAALTLGAVLHAQEPPALRPWPANPWYWSLNGQPVLLLGGSDDDNLFQWTEQKLIAQLDRLAAAGGNYIRNTMSDRRIEGFEVYAYARRPDGRYDLGQWNDEYWQRFERLLRETARRNIVVQIEVWDRFDFTDHTSEKHWQAHPYNPANNVNYTAAQSGLATRYADHPGLNRQPFFFTTPNQRHNRTLLAVQQRFVDKLLDHSLGYDHVLYCMDNETNGEEAWSRYWAEYIKEQARRRGQQVQVTEMWGDWRLTGAEHRRTFDHPELFDFVEVSQNTHKSGQRQWDDLAAARAYLSGQPRPMNTVKVYGAKGSAFGQTDQKGIERFWIQLFGGSAAVRFHRPDAGLGLSDSAVASLRAACKLNERVPLWSVQPANGLLAEREANEAYLVADGRGSYGLYFPAGGSVQLDLKDVPGQLTVHWIDIKSGKRAGQQAITGGHPVAITAPGPGNWAAAIVRQP